MHILLGTIFNIFKINSLLTSTDLFSYHFPISPPPHSSVTITVPPPPPWLRTSLYNNCSSLHYYHNTINWKFMCLNFFLQNLASRFRMSDNALHWTQNFSALCSRALHQGTTGVQSYSGTQLPHHQFLHTKQYTQHSTMRRNQKY